MKCSFFSDLHIKKPHDLASELFIKFCESKEVKQSQTIYFLGDMFDMLIGEHKEYLLKYDYFFENIIKFLDNDQRVIFLEGNHDFHLKKTMTNYVAKNSKNPELFRYLNNGEKIELNYKNYYFCHGDDVDYYNIYFKRWKRVYTSLPFKIMVNNLFPYKFVDYLGHSASNDSKKRGKKVFDYSKAKEKYIKGARALLNERNVDGVIAGHTHIHEMHRFEDGKQYINCGYPLKDKLYVHFDGESFKSISLTDS